MSLAAVKSLAVMAVLAGMFVAERLWPAVRVRARWPRLVSNIGLAFVNFLLGPTIVLPVSAFALRHGLGLRPGWWPMVFDLLVLDLWIYAWHRLNHVLPVLWRFHAIHHLDETLDATSAIRFHFGEVALSALARAGVIWLLSIPLGTVIVFETLVVLAAIFQHSNLRLAPRFEAMLAQVIVTPQIHWVHHHALRADTDSNYATILSVWDRLFGSRSAHRRTLDMKIGLDGEADVPLPALLGRPFFRR